jgi:sulfate-transporting ATPase
MAQYVYTMNRVGKIVPPKRQILKDISLSFFPGAKIGVLGVNGSGKSTLLKIMAGIDKEYEGEATPMPGLKIGYLPQEPQAAARADRARSGGSGMGEVLPPRQRLEEVYAAYAEPDADFDALASRAGQLEAIIAPPATESGEHQLEIAADALRLPPWDAVIKNLSGGEKRRVALCQLLLSKPDMLLLDEPTNHLDAESVEWLEQFLARFLGHRGRHHPRPLLPGQRRRVDPGTGPRPSASPGRATTAPGWSRRKRAWRQSSGRGRPHQGDEEGTGVGPRQPQGRQAKSKARLARFEELSDYEYQKRNETNEIFIPVASAWA